VRLRYGTDRLDIEVADDGHGQSAPITGGSGLGLVGMRERIDVLGGTLRAGPRDGGGFSVRAALPVTTSEHAT
jgi:signal transduction histidine kinase